MSRPLVECYELGMVEYQEAFRVQIQLSNLVKARDLFGFLLFLEHCPTVTLGYSFKGDEGKTELRASEDSLAQKGIKVFHTDRGGKATFHGPGQLVAYPILNLNKFKLSSKRYVNKLEDVVIRWLTSSGIDARRDLDYPGVWVSDKKIASVGVRIENRISRHGFAVNLCPDLGFFDLIVPCGIAGRKMTSFLELTGVKLDPKDAVPGLSAEFSAVFDVELKRGEPDKAFDEGGLNDDQRMADAGPV